jgi:hypothetical protein
VRDSAAPFDGSKDQEERSGSGQKTTHTGAATMTEHCRNKRRRGEGDGARQTRCSQCCATLLRTSACARFAPDRNGVAVAPAIAPVGQPPGRDRSRTQGNRAGGKANAGPVTDKPAQRRQRSRRPQCRSPRPAVAGPAAVCGNDPADGSVVGSTRLPPHPPARLTTRPGAGGGGGEGRPWRDTAVPRWTRGSPRSCHKGPPAGGPVRKSGNSNGGVRSRNMFNTPRKLTRSLLCNRFPEMFKTKYNNVGHYRTLLATLGGGGRAAHPRRADAREAAAAGYPLPLPSLRAVPLRRWHTCCSASGFGHQWLRASESKQPSRPLL